MLTDKSCLYPDCYNNLGINNKSGFCSKHRHYTESQKNKASFYRSNKRLRNTSIVIEEAKVRKVCAYKNLALPEGLSCPIFFSEEAYHVGWEWDHIFDYEKHKGISEMINSNSAERLVLELSKCALTCSFHHNLITWKRQHGEPDFGIAEAILAGTRAHYPDFKG